MARQAADQAAQTVAAVGKELATAISEAVGSAKAAQGEAELTQTLAAARETFSILASALRDNQLEDRLECELRSDSFRRLVH